MANVLSGEKQIAVIGALAEGSGIRQIERMTGVHRDTIMRLSACHGFTHSSDHVSKSSSQSRNRPGV